MEKGATVRAEQRLSSVFLHSPSRTSKTAFRQLTSSFRGTKTHWPRRSAESMQATCITRRPRVPSARRALFADNVRSRYRNGISDRHASASARSNAIERRQMPKNDRIKFTRRPARYRREACLAALGTRGPSRNNVRAASIRRRPRQCVFVPLNARKLPEAVLRTLRDGEWRNRRMRALLSSTVSPFSS